MLDPKIFGFQNTKAKLGAFLAYKPKPKATGSPNKVSNVLNRNADQYWFVIFCKFVRYYETALL
jgi:hypothetical protein